MPAADTYRAPAPAPPVPADVWAAPSEPVSEPEPEPVPFGSAENGGPGRGGFRGAWRRPDGRGQRDRLRARAPACRRRPDRAWPPRPDTAAAARVFDAATTRRRSVVFEEDDELDVPDFLK